MYNHQKVLLFIDTERDGRTDPSHPYLSRFPETYSNIYI